MAAENFASHPPLTNKQAAEFLQLHPVTLARMRQYGRGPAYVKRGGLVYYLLSDIMAWLEDGRVQPGKKSQAQSAVRRRGRPRMAAPVEDVDAPASAGLTL